MAFCWVSPSLGHSSTAAAVLVGSSLMPRAWHGEGRKNEAPHKPQRARKGRLGGLACGFCLVQNCSRGLRWGTWHKITHAVLLCPSGHESSVILSHLAWFSSAHWKKGKYRIKVRLFAHLQVFHSFWIFHLKVPWKSFAVIFWSPKPKVRFYFQHWWMTRKSKQKKPQRQYCKEQ